MITFDPDYTEPEFVPANARCNGCGAPMLTNGRWFKCEYCGGGITESKKIKEFDSNEYYKTFYAKSQMPIVLHNPFRTWIDIERCYC